MNVEIIKLTTLHPSNKFFNFEMRIVSTSIFSELYLRDKCFTVHHYNQYLDSNVAPSDYLT